ncbi:MAG: hypothetical protein HYS55_00405, partial [Candidatus Omnitrophica bacterium]|nr:hypothetical protein [Candidatus Omnitrophota bacterium]
RIEDSSEFGVSSFKLVQSGPIGLTSNFKLGTRNLISRSDARGQVTLWDGTNMNGDAFLIQDVLRRKLAGLDGFEVRALNEEQIIFTLKGDSVPANVRTGDVQQQLDWILQGTPYGRAEVRNEVIINAIGISRILTNSPPLNSSPARYEVIELDITPFSESFKSLGIELSRDSRGRLVYWLARDNSKVPIFFILTNPAKSSYGYDELEQHLFWIDPQGIDNALLGKVVNESRALGIVPLPMIYEDFNAAYPIDPRKATFTQRAGFMRVNGTPVYGQKIGLILRRSEARMKEFPLKADTALRKLIGVTERGLNQWSVPLVHNAKTRKSLERLLDAAQFLSVKNVGAVYLVFATKPKEATRLIDGFTSIVFYEKRTGKVSALDLTSFKGMNGVVGGLYGFIRNLGEKAQFNSSDGLKPFPATVMFDHQTGEITISPLRSEARADDTQSKNISEALAQLDQALSQITTFRQAIAQDYGKGKIAWADGFVERAETIHGQAIQKPHQLSQIQQATRQLKSLLQRFKDHEIKVGSSSMDLGNQPKTRWDLDKYDKFRRSELRTVELTPGSKPGEIIVNGKELSITISPAWKAEPEKFAKAINDALNLDPKTFRALGRIFVRGKHMFEVKFLTNSNVIESRYRVEDNENFFKALQTALPDPLKDKLKHSKVPGFLGRRSIQVGRIEVNGHPVEPTGLLGILTHNWLDNWLQTDLPDIGLEDSSYESANIFYGGKSFIVQWESPAIGSERPSQFNTLELLNQFEAALKEAGITVIHRSEVRIEDEETAAEIQELGVNEVIEELLGVEIVENSTAARTALLRLQDRSSHAEPVDAQLYSQLLKDVLPLKNRVLQPLRDRYSREPNPIVRDELKEEIAANQRYFNELEKLMGLRRAEVRAEKRELRIAIEDTLGEGRSWGVVWGTSQRMTRRVLPGELIRSELRETLRDVLFQAARRSDRHSESGLNIILERSIPDAQDYFIGIAEDLRRNPKLYIREIVLSGDTPTTEGLNQAFQDQFPDVATRFRINLVSEKKLVTGVQRVIHEVQGSVTSKRGTLATDFFDRITISSRAAELLEKISDAVPAKWLIHDDVDPHPGVQAELLRRLSNLAFRRGLGPEALRLLEDLGSKGQIISAKQHLLADVNFSTLIQAWEERTAILAIGRSA